MDLQRLQDEVRRLMAGIEHPRVGAALALAEECGEVVRCVLEREVYGADDPAGLGAEMGDVLLALAELADRYDLSLEVCARDALAKLERMAPEWRARLGERLHQLRARLDGGP